jgi:3-demethoxyubiquinol 3-hydroxylase
MGRQRDAQIYRDSCGDPSQRARAALSYDVSVTIDSLILGLDRALRTVSGSAVSGRPNPAENAPDAPLAPDERRHAVGLMRVNHTGEVCAQALYQAQALTGRDPETRSRLAQAAREEEDHLAWTQERLSELGGRTSLANPVWYAGSFAIGLLAGLAGDRTSLGFVVETERQVEEHLTGHMDRLPLTDARSRVIVAAMRDDEVRHGMAAHDAGARDLPWPMRALMRMAAKLMTVTAYRL